MQVWIGQARFLQLLRLLVLLYLAGNARAFAVDVTLSWDPNSEPTLAGYKLYYGPTTRTYSETIVVGDKTTYTVTGLGGGTYYFAVTAYDTLGNETGYSSEVSNGVPPAATSFNLGVTGASVGSVSLTWDKTTDPAAVNYNLYRGTASGNYTTYADLNLATTSYTFTGLTPGVTYYFAIAYDTSAGQSEYSNEVSQSVPAAGCTYSIAPLSQSFESAGGTGSAAVSSSTGCNWSAASSAGWITIASGSSGEGNGTVTYTVETNSSTSSRTGTMTIAGQTFRVTQAGLVPPTTTSFDLRVTGASAGSVSLTWNKTTDPAAVNYNLYRGTSSGNYTSYADLNVATTSYTFTGLTPGVTYYFAIAYDTWAYGDSDLSNEVSQTVPAVACTYSISPLSQSFASTAGTGSAAVASSNGCGWSAGSNATWITITAGGSGGGNGTVTYTVETNSSTSSRTGTMTIAGQTYTVTQAGSVPPTTTSFNLRVTGASAGSVSLRWNKTTNPAAVNYNLYRGTSSGNYATYADLPVATTRYTFTGLTPGVTYYFAIAYDTWAGESEYSDEVSQTVPVEVSEAMLAGSRSEGCTYSISPASRSFPYAGGSGALSVACGSGCTWAVSGAAGWININSPGSGTGGGTVTYSLERNDGEHRRRGKLTIAGQTFVVEQAGRNEAAFTQVANGAEWVSSIVLTNPSTTETVTGSLNLLDDRGEPLVVSLNNQSPAEAISFAIQPSGSATFTSDGTGDLVSGSAQLSADNPVSGVVKYSHPALGIVGVGASVPSDGFIAPVTRSATESSSTGVAIASTGLPVKVTLTLRDESGVPVPGGGSALELPANGHLARFLEQLFPDAETREFRGTVTVTAEGGRIVGTVLRFGSKGQITELPVTPLP